jgi:hypothetical protein
MALTSVGAIYATGSKLLQRIYVPHADDSEIAQQHVASGETLMTVSLATFQSGGQAAIQALIGTPNVSGSGFSNSTGRCAVANSGTVSAVIVADPALYTDPGGGTVVPHNTAMVNDAWTGSIFNRPVAEISFVTGKIVTVSIQNIDAATVATTGNYLWNIAGMPVALPGTEVLMTGKIGTPSGLVAGVAVQM